MRNVNRFLFEQYEKDVNKVCECFMASTGLSYFCFRRKYADNTSIILANNSNFLVDFIESNIQETSYNPVPSANQSWVYFWEEAGYDNLILFLRQKHNLYHGITLLNRHKDYYDCFAFGLPEINHSVGTYYLDHMHEIKTFAQYFPQMAKDLIELVSRQRINVDSSLPFEAFCSYRLNNGQESFLLPERSERFPLGLNPESYITTYELLCLRLLFEKKTYSEIGSILSMSPRTVETHLARLKARTDYTFEKILLKTTSYSRDI